MRTLGLVLLVGLCALAASASAGSRLPGETFADAIPIPSLPFSVLGSTVGYSMDHGDMCPYGCLGPDVVYRYIPTGPGFVEFSLCHPGTDFDTNLYIYTIGTYPTLVACNEDGCSTEEYPDPWLSRIGALRVQAGTTYYIVVSGYCDQAGNYELTVTDVADPFFVRPDGRGAFPDLSHAIGAAVDGDTIELADGVFTGWGNLDNRFMGKAITIRSRSSNPEACIIDPAGDGRGFIFDDGEGPNSVLEGVTIRNGQGHGWNGGGAIYCQASHPTIRNCIFEDNAAEAGGACAFRWSASPTLMEECRFLGNVALGEGGAVIGEANAAGQPVATFLRCTFHGNRADLRGGALAITQGVVELTGCTVVKNAVTSAAGTGGGVHVGSGASMWLTNSIVALNRAFAGGGAQVLGAATVGCCDFHANNGGHWTGTPSPIGANGNIALDPLFCDNENLDFRLAADSPCRPFPPENPSCDLVGAWPVACGATAVDGEETPIFSIGARPNPFFGTCRISLGTADRGRTVVTISDPSGRAIRRIRSASRAGAAIEVVWDGHDDSGADVPSGVYFARITGVRDKTGVKLVLAR